MCAEILDWAALYSEARQIIELEGLRCERILRHLSQEPASESDRRLLKQQVWVAIHWFSTFYRTHQYETARAGFELCRSCLLDYVQSTEDPCLLTTSRIYYSLGLSRRQVHDYKRAREWFEMSINYAWRSFDYHINALPVSRTDRLFEKSLRLSRFYVAKNLSLGLAWTYYVLGEVSTAATLLTAARLLIAQLNESVISASIRIVESSVLRAKGDLDTAIAVATDAHDSLAGAGSPNEAYQIRAANELAITYLHRYLLSGNEVDVFSSKQYTEEVMKFAERNSDTRWQCNGLIMTSRIQRSNRLPDEAITSASKALQLGSDQRFIMAEALIARGEAAIDLHRSEAASRDFGDALALLAAGFDNPKTRLACHVHLARVALMNSDSQAAHRHWATCQQLMPRVENVFLHRLCMGLGETLGKEPDEFRVSSDAKKVNPKQLENDLHAFLARWAKRQPDAGRAPWKLLDISKQAYYTWLKKSKRA